MDKEDKMTFCWCSGLLFWMWVTICGGGSCLVEVALRAPFWSFYKFVCSKALQKSSHLSLSANLGLFPILPHLLSPLGSFTSLGNKSFCLLSQGLMCMRWTLTQYPRIVLSVAYWPCLTAGPIDPDGPLEAAYWSAWWEVWQTRRNNRSTWSSLSTLT